MTVSVSAFTKQIEAWQAYCARCGWMSMIGHLTREAAEREAHTHVCPPVATEETAA